MKPAVGTIELSHKACEDEFRRNSRSHSCFCLLHLYNIDIFRTFLYGCGYFPFWDTRGRNIPPKKMRTVPHSSQRLRRSRFPNQNCDRSCTNHKSVQKYILIACCCAPKLRSKGRLRRPNSVIFRVREHFLGQRRATVGIAIRGTMRVVQIRGCSLGVDGAPQLKSYEANIVGSDA